MYKQKLIALLEGLECQKIPDLVEKSCEHLRKVGQEITKYAKVGAAIQQADSVDENSNLCLCPLHFGDCEECVDGKCKSPLI